MISEAAKALIPLFLVSWHFFYYTLYLVKETDRRRQWYMPKYLPINCLFWCIIDEYYYDSRLDFQLTDPARLLDEALARLILDGQT